MFPSPTVVFPPSLAAPIAFSCFFLSSLPTSYLTFICCLLQLSFLPSPASLSPARQFQFRHSACQAGPNCMVGTCKDLQRGLAVLRNPLPPQHTHTVPESPAPISSTFLVSFSSYYPSANLSFVCPLSSTIVIFNLLASRLAVLLWLPSKGH